MTDNATPHPLNVDADLVRDDLDLAAGDDGR